VFARVLNVACARCTTLVLVDGRLLLAVLFPACLCHQVARDDLGRADAAALIAANPTTPKAEVIEEVTLFNGNATANASFL